MKKQWKNPRVKSLGIKETNNLEGATCLMGIPTWPSGMLGPVWNDGEKEWQCSSMGQGAGVNGHLPDGDFNKIPRCPYIHSNNKTCIVGGVSVGS